MTLLDIQHLTKEFVIESDWLGRPKKILTAVHDVSLAIEAGETVGLVGESGCGKSTFARTILGLYEKTHGTVLYKGRNIDQNGVHEKFAVKDDTYASGSTDVGNVSYDTRVCQPEIEIGEDIAAHTLGFASAAGSVYGKMQALTGAKAMIGTAA